MPRIAHVVSTPSGVGGAERVVASLVRAGIERGWSPLVVNPFARDRHRSELAAICEPAPYAGHPCESPLGLPRLRRWLGATVGEFAPDIVHAHLVHAGIATATLRLPARARSVLTHHHGNHLAFLGHRGMARLDRWAGRRYDRVVAISEWVRAFLLSTYGYPAEKVSLIRNGWEGEPRLRSGGDREPTVICVANFRHQKGHTDLLSAFAQVRHQLPSRLVLVGDGVLGPELRSEAEVLDLAGSVDFRGHVDDVWGQLARADVFALASLYEPFGIAVLEAMAAGLPVVAAAVGGIPELVEPGLTGELVEPEDPAGMAEQLARLLTSPELQRSMGEAARRRADGLRMESTVAAYFDLYESLTAEGAGGRG